MKITRKSKVQEQQASKCLQHFFVKQRQYRFFGMTIGLSNVEFTDSSKSGSSSTVFMEATLQNLNKENR